MKERNTNKKWKILTLALSVGSIVCLLALLFFQSLDLAINSPTFHLDGAFQTASGLFRLDSGQASGRDFFPYIGIGPLLLIFPFFKIAGGTLSASVFAAKFVTLALGWIAVSGLWQLIFRPRIAIFSLVGGGVVFIATDLIARKLSFPNPFAFVFETGNSLRPIRAAISYIISIASYFLINHSKIGLKRNVLAGLLVGISLLWSNDFAIPTAGLLAGFYFLLFYLKENSTWKKSAMTFSLASFFSWALLLSLITAGHPFELIKYNLIDVATDQWWYFGPYHPNTRVFQIGQVLKIIYRENYFPFTVFLVVSIFAIKTRKIEHALIALIGLILFAGGSLASLGGHFSEYFDAFYYWGAITTVLVALRSFQLFVYKKITLNLQRFSFRETWPVIPIFFSLLAGASEGLINYKKNSAHAKNDSGRYFIPELGGYLGLGWKDYIDYARQNRGSKVIEEYWGIWSALNRSFPQWPVDSAIHALGNVRGVAKAALPDADLIISTRYIFSSEWQPWNLSQNFWFYEDLLLNWVPDFISPTTVVWRKADKSREYQDVNCRASENEKSFAIDSEDIGYYKVTLNYTLSGAGRYLLMVQNNISYGADAGGYVSLPPGSSTATIPTLVTKELGNVFDVKIIGNDNIYLKIKSCSAQKISYSNDETLHIRSENDFFLTDWYWAHGIARDSSRFFVPNKIPYTREYKIGKYVFLPNIDFRKIIDITPNGPYLNVKFEGPALNPVRVGLPSKFQVVDTPHASTHSILDNFYLTDENWNKGVAKAWAGFFVPNTYYYSTNFKTGKHVRFLNGDVRKIIKVTAFEKYLNVDVEGAILSPQEAGLPSEYSILEK